MFFSLGPKEHEGMKICRGPAGELRTPMLHLRGWDGSAGPGGFASFKQTILGWFHADLMVIYGYGYGDLDDWTDPGIGTWIGTIRIYDQTWFDRKSARGFDVCLHQMILNFQIQEVDEVDATW